MPIYIVALRFTMLFLNIYDSFKTLKLPPPSARNNGKPSIRAMTQRKRDMKGCLAVWIVWCCFTTYERLLENLVYLFIPFYSEFKALFMLFLILTRARGAEPIFLHVIRPFIKPYASTLDSLLDAVKFVGDFLVILGMTPVHMLQSAHDRWTGRELETESDVYRTPPPQHPSRLNHAAQSDSAIPRYPSNLGVGRPGQRSVSAQQLRPERPDDVHRHSSASDVHPVFEVEKARRPSPAHEIWYPPASAYDDQIDGLPPVASQSEDMEWRQYPPFPSAYPPTPIMPTSKRNLGHDAGMASQFSLTSRMDYPAIPEEQPEGSQRGFRQSLSPARESMNPDSVSSLSDSDNTGVQTADGGYISSDSSMLVDEGDTSEDDIFNFTLRTPLSRPPRMDDSASSTPSTTLDTLDNASTLRTDTPESSSRDSPPPVAGRKRSLPKDDTPAPLGEISFNTQKPKSSRRLKSVEVETSSADDIVEKKPPETKRRRVVPPSTTRVTRGSSKTKELEPETRPKTRRQRNADVPDVPRPAPRRRVYNPASADPPTTNETRQRQQRVKAAK